ncbi:membrane protein [Rhodococcus phage MacGully]|nr:membrane protein [Rhodococcus phage MacGully]
MKSILKSAGFRIRYALLVTTSEVGPYLRQLYTFIFGKSAVAQANIWGFLSGGALATFFLIGITVQWQHMLVMPVLFLLISLLGALIGFLFRPLAERLVDWVERKQDEYDERDWSIVDEHNEADQAAGEQPRGKFEIGTSA